MKIGTHNGVFHADDLFAVAALKMLFKVDAVVRTRDEKALAECGLVVDVGGVYSQETLQFDHHQRGFYDPKGSYEANLARGSVRINGVPYSSFGLVWRCFGSRITGSSKVAARVDETIVQSVDAADCGFSLHGKPTIEGARSLSISAALSSLNPTWEEGGDFDNAFDAAVEVAAMFLKRAIAAAKGTVNAETAVQQAQAAAGDDPVVVLDKFVPWGEFDFPPAALYVVFPSEVGTWMVQAIPPRPGSFDKRKPLPASWGGLRDAEFSKVTGLDGSVFCHVGLFICGHQTREGALALARLAVEA